MALIRSIHDLRKSTGARKISLLKIALLSGGLLVIVLGPNPLFSQTNSPPPPNSAPTTDSSTSPKAGQTWTNSLGMVFKPVPGTSVLFNRYDTTVQDSGPSSRLREDNSPGGSVQ